MQAATAIGVGYLLGRRKKFRTATMLAAATAVGRTTAGGIAMKRGMKMLSSNEALQSVAPQLGQLTEIVRGDLLSAGKAAAAAAVSNRMDALTDSLHDRTERMRNPEAEVAEGADSASKTGKKAAGTGKRTAGGTARRVTERGRAAEDEPEDEDYEARDVDARDEDYEDDEEDYQEEAEEDDFETETDDEADDEPGADDEADAPPARGARPAHSSGTRRRSPVARTRG